MRSGRFVFSQVMDHLPMKAIRRCAQRYRGNCHIRSFTGLDQFLCMAFAPLTFPREPARYRGVSAISPRQCPTAPCAESRLRGGGDTPSPPARASSGRATNPMAGMQSVRISGVECARQGDVARIGGWQVAAGLAERHEVALPDAAPGTRVTGGKTIYGASLGILSLETRFPRVPGDMGNAGTWPFPVLYAVVPGASPQRVVRERAQGLLEPFLDAARGLVRAGVDGITTSCGFLSLFQAELSAACSVPVAASSLMQIPPRRASAPAGTARGRDHDIECGPEPRAPGRGRGRDGYPGSGHRLGPGVFESPARRPGRTRRGRGRGRRARRRRQAVPRPSAGRRHRARVHEHDALRSRRQTPDQSPRA